MSSCTFFFADKNNLFAEKSSADRLFDIPLQQKLPERK